MNARSCCAAWGVGLTTLGVASLLTLASAADKAAEPMPANDVQDLVFLGETRPLLIRLHVQVDGQPIQANRAAFLKSVFRYLDVNNDGVLSKEEVEHLPTVDQILSGGVSAGLAQPKAKGPSTLEMLDTDKDGQVTLAELEANAYKLGFAPFQVQVANPQNRQLEEFARISGRRGEPLPTAVSEAIFALIDTNKDGKLTREELTAAATVLLRLDDNEDEIVTAAELVPDVANPAGQSEKMGAMMAGPAAKGPSGVNKLVALHPPVPGALPPTLVRQMQERYGPKSDKPEEKKLTSKDLGLDAETFAQLDANKDGTLNASELEGFVKRTADLALTVRVGKGKSPAGIELASGTSPPSPLAAKLSATNGVVFLNLGLMRVDVRTTEEASPTFFAGIMRQQQVAFFKSADKDNNGYVDEKEAGTNPRLKNLFKLIDRDGDGKVYEKELIAFLDQYQEFQKQALAGCVTLVVSDQHKGLFDLLDADRDGRLSVREIRRAPQLLEQFDSDRKGWLTRTDLPRSYQLTLRRGPVDTGSQNDAKAFAAIYGGNYSSDSNQGTTAGPLWFRKMDKNRDGDVSRKEFLGTEEEFRKIDSDGDGLISLEEAKQADAQLRKESR